MSGVTILLGISVYQMILNEKLPATSDSVPILGKLVGLKLIRVAPFQVFDSLRRWNTTWHWHYLHEYIELIQLSVSLQFCF